MGDREKAQLESGMRISRNMGDIQSQLDMKEEDMMRHVMEMSKEESKLEEAKLTEEEL